MRFAKTKQRQEVSCCAADHSAGSIRASFPNLASRALGLCLRRLSRDWQEKWNHPVLVVESFVDETRYKGVSKIALLEVLVKKYICMLQFAAMCSKCSYM